VSAENNEITILILLQDALYYHIIQFGCNTEVLFLASFCVCVSIDKNVKWALHMNVQYCMWVYYLGFSLHICWYCRI